MIKLIGGGLFVGGAAAGLLAVAGHPVTNTTLTIALALSGAIAGIVAWSLSEIMR